MQQLFLGFLFFLCLATGLSAQISPTVPLEEDSSAIRIRKMNQLRTERKADGDYNYMRGDVLLQQNQVFFWCDTALLKPNNRLFAYGDVEINQNDSIHIFSDSLRYNGLTRKAQLMGNVALSDSMATLFTEELFYDMNQRMGYYENQGAIYSDSAKLTSRRAYYYVDSSTVYFKDSVRFNHPRLNLTADTLEFNTETEEVYFHGPTYIFNEDKMIYCESGFYDSQRDYAEFIDEAFFVNQEDSTVERAFGDTIIYYGKTRSYTLKGDASLEDEERIVRSEVIHYDGSTDSYRFEGNPEFESTDKSQSIISEESYYDAEQEKMSFIGSVFMQDGDNQLRADSVDYYETKKDAKARGHVVWTDMSSGSQIFCGAADYNDSTGYLFARRSPLMSTLVEEDTLWMRADTLISYRDHPEEETDSLRTLLAYPRVMFFKSDLQGLCDSMAYRDVDSVFRMFDNPRLWADSVQFTADTINMLLKNEQIHRIQLRQRAFIVNTLEQKYFDQIKGNNMLVYFREQELQAMDVETGAESVYYIRDEQDAYVGVNDVDATDMFVYFGDRQVQRIKFVSQPKATLYPMGQVGHQSLRLEGFRWLEAQRPKSKQSLLDLPDVWGSAPPRSEALPSAVPEEPTE